VLPRQRLLLSVALIAALLVSDAINGWPAADAPPRPQRVESFGFANIQRLAQQRASQPYTERTAKLPENLAKLGYDEYRDIRYRPTAGLWHGQSMFEVQFFHLGFNFSKKVNISEVADEGVRPVQYNTSQFDFGKQAVPTNLPPDLGYAGFRVHFPLQTPAYKDELIVFLGASYFRVLGRNQGYGLSARGLAINTANSGGEEFPYFTDFWLVRPQAQDRHLTIYAILDSPSIAGAYRFDIRPGSTTQVEVTSELYPRKAIEKLGIAPLTSMFLYGENRSGRQFDDFRPEVHDSDGLLAQTGAGEWLWRPLANPKDLQVTRFMDDNPKTFGLSQRDRVFAHYEDNESRYHLRPSYQIEPLGGWGKGGVELVEIPSDEEIHDNIVAYWVPEQPVVARKPLRFSYLLSAFSESTRWPPGGTVIATRSGSANVGELRNQAAQGVRRILVDFAGGDLKGLDPSQPVKAEISANNGSISDVTVERLPQSDTWRVAFKLDPKGSKAVDLRGYLTLYGEVLTETWTHLWKP